MLCFSWVCVVFELSGSGCYLLRVSARERVEYSTKCAKVAHGAWCGGLLLRIYGSGFSALWQMHSHGDVLLGHRTGLV